ncbi:hypothetical protein LINGRAHAP2_LOCUS23704 [Linum grandiflorum]
MLSQSTFMGRLAPPFPIPLTPLRQHDILLLSKE